jgi:hypothetical protein
VTPISRSTISENPISVETIRSPDSDLRIEAFTNFSKSIIGITPEGNLTLNVTINEVLISYTYTEIIDLQINIEDNVNLIADVKQTGIQNLGLDADDLSIKTTNQVDVIPLTIKAFLDNRIEDPPSESWRQRPGLPIQPIGYSPIAVEQFDINFQSFSDVNQGGFEITSFDAVEVSLNSIDSAILNLGDQDTFSIRSDTVSQGNLGTFSFDSREIILNAFTTGLLEIAAEDQIQQIFSFADTVFAGNAIGFDQTSISYFSYDDANALITARSFFRGYTFNIQEGTEDRIVLSLNVDSDEIYRPVFELPPPVQIWIG